MANYNKSFNFRNGVQVDTDKFIVNTAGLVGIGSTLPTNYLDVQGGATVTGDIKVTGGDITVTGLVTSSQLNVSGISTVGFLTSNSDAYVSGVVTATRFYGSGLYLDDIVGFTTESWNVVRAKGASVDRTGLTTTSKIGIGTTEANNSYDLIIGSDPSAVASNGISFDASTGNVRSSGTIQADLFDGNVNAGIVTGTLQTAAQSKITSLGDLTTLTVLGNAGIGSINVSGVSTFTGISTFGGNVSFGATSSFNDNSKLRFGDGGDLKLYHNGTTSTSYVQDDISGNLRICSNDIRFRSSDDGTTTFYVGHDGETQLYYNTNIKLRTSGVGVTVYDQLDTNRVVSGVGSFGSIGIGTTIPATDFQIRREAADTDATLQVISEKKTAIVAVGDSESLTGHTGQFRYGHTTGSDYSDEISLDIINYSRGSINNFLNADLQTGIGTGDFNWIVGETNNPNMTLTYEGNLGIGITLPEHNLHVVGTSTVTTDAYVGNNLEIGNDLTVKGTTTFTGTVVSDLEGDIYSPNNTRLFYHGTDGGGDAQLQVGILTASTSIKSGSVEITAIGIGTFPDNNYPLKIKDTPGDRVYVSSDGNIGIGTDQNYPEVKVAIPHSSVIVGNSVGIGTTLSPQCALDVGVGGTETTRFIRLPKVDGSTERVGLATLTGALIYNTYTSKLNYWTGVAWKVVAEA